MHSKVLSFFIFIITLFTIHTSSAQQLSSQEKSKIKKQLKLYLRNPGVFKREQELMSNELAALNKSLVTMKDRAENAELTLKKGKDESTRCQEELELKNQIITDLNNRLNSTNGSCQVGEYKVQIGKFDNFSLDSYLKKGKCINFEVQNGLKVYTVDGFNDSKEAFNMAQQLRRLGLKGAFVTRFKNNKRINYDHVVETGEQPYYDIKDNTTVPIPKVKPMVISTPAKINYAGEEEIKKEGYGHSNVKPAKKIINKIIEPEDEDIDMTIEDEGAELNTLENKSIRIGEKNNSTEEIIIKEPIKMTTTPNNVKLSLPESKPKVEDNFEDYEEVKEIPE